MNDISQRQFSFLIFIIFLCFSFVGVPSHLAKNCNTDGILVLLVVSFLGYGAYYCLIKVFSSYKDKSFNEVLEHLLGKAFGRIFYVVFLVGTVFYISAGLRIITEQVNVYMLRTCPFIVVELVFLVLSIYLVSKRVKTLFNFSQIAIYPIIAIISLLAICTVVNVELENMLPLFNSSFKDISRSVLILMSYLFSGIMLVPIFMKRVDSFDEKKALLEGIYIIGGVFLIYAVYYIMCIGVLGTDLTGREMFPSLTIMQSNKSKYVFLERYEILLLSAVLLMFFVYISALMKGVLMSIQIKEKKKKRFIQVGILLSVFVVMLVFNSRTIGILSLLSELKIISPNLFLPFMLYGAMQIKKKKDKAQTS